jgi:hypothetical protein
MTNFTNHKIIQTVNFVDFNGTKHVVAKLKSHFTNKTFWATLDNEGNPNLPFFNNQNTIESNLLLNN